MSRYGTATAHLARIFQGALAMFLCALAVGAVISFVPVWPGHSGRDFRLPGAMMAVLFFVAGFVLRARFRWPVVDLLASLVCAEAIALCVIAGFSGGLALEDIFQTFNLWWLGTVSLFIAPPWLAGLAVGSLMARNSP